MRWKRAFELAEAHLQICKFNHFTWYEEKLYDWNAEVASNAIDVHVCQLRKKLGGDFIHTLRGVGYKIPLPVN